MKVDLTRIDQALTSKKWQWLFHEQDTCPPTVQEALSLNLPQIDSESWQHRIKLGGVYVNGLEVKADVALTAPCKLEYYEPKFKLEDIHQVFPSFDSKWIVYEDPFLLVVYKPAGLPCLPTKEQKLYNLRSYIEKYCGKKIHMPSRIDSSTQGLVIVSIHEKMHNYIQKAFERRLVSKRYLLEVSHKTEWDVKFLSAEIGKDPSHPILRKVVAGGGRKSITIFSLINTGTKRNFLFAKPLSGRTHQIRLHAAHLGIPIIGDNFYGGAQAERLRLLSYSVGVWQPLINKYLHVAVPRELMPEWARVCNV